MRCARLFTDLVQDGTIVINLLIVVVIAFTLHGDYSVKYPCYDVDFGTISVFVLRHISNHIWYFIIQAFQHLVFRKVELWYCLNECVKSNRLELVAVRLVVQSPAVILR